MDNFATNENCAISSYRLYTLGPLCLWQCFLDAFPYSYVYIWIAQTHTISPPCVEISAFRNDIDLVGVRAGCTFTGFTGSKFNGQSGVVRGGKASDTWVVLERYFLILQTFS